MTPSIILVGFIAAIFTTLVLLVHLYIAQTKQQPLMKHWRWSLLQAIGQFLFLGHWLIKGVLPETVGTTIALIGITLTVAGGIGVLRSMISMRSETTQEEPPQRERIGNR